MEHIDSGDNQNSDRWFAFDQIEIDRLVLLTNRSFLPVNFEVGLSHQYYLSGQLFDENVQVLGRDF